MSSMSCVKMPLVAVPVSTASINARFRAILMTVLIEE